MKILFQIRPNALTQRGGDTVDLERIASGLSNLGVVTQIDVAGTANVKDFDCVFLFNFTLPQLLKEQAQRAKNAGVPYVVLALNEDIPSFHSQSHTAAAVLMEYVKAGQPTGTLPVLYPNPWATAPAPRFENEWVARNAAIVFTTGESESRVISQYYPGLTNLCALPLGFDIVAQGSAQAFEAEFGIKDFVLSVGRVESRKNQLMLLKALEHDNIPVVIAGGGFTYQPDYDHAVRSFKRAGPTIILGKLTEAQLANAYAAAKVHALPSWYELPGLVSMEAASCGKNVVVTDMGTTRDYFGSSAFYCDPANPEAVRNAVLAAYHGPVIKDLGNKIRSFSWAQTAEHVLSALQQVITERHTQPSRNALRSYVPATPAEAIQEAETIARTGDFKTALELVSAHKTANPTFAGLWRAEGMLLIAMQRHQEAQTVLNTALTLDPNDSRVISGLGICARQNGNIQAAHDLFVRALHVDKSNKVALLQLLAVSYDLNSFVALEATLRDYVSLNPADVDMAYALAGSLFKQQKFDDARRYCEEVITRVPNHSGATELLALIEKQRPAAPKAQVVNQPLSSPQIAVNGSATSNSPVLEGIIRITDLKRNFKISQGLQECSALIGSMAVNSPELEEVYSLQAELMALDGQVVESERRFNAILAQFPSSVRSLCGLGALYGEQKNWVKAEEFFRKAIALNPGSDVGYAGLALSSLNAGDKEAAWHYYEKALSVNPENLRAVFGILELGYPQARYKEIERVLTNYLELHPANLDFLYSLAGCFYAQNRLQEAAQEVEKILMFSPGHAKAIELRQAIETRLTSR